MNHFLRFYMLIAIALFFSCKSDKTAPEQYDLEGKWNIYEASRDGELTTTLEDGYFLFRDSIMETNILGNPIEGKYIFESEAFRHDSSLPATYKITEYSSDTMQLRTEIREFDFIFKLQRISDATPINEQ